MYQLCINMHKTFVQHAITRIGLSSLALTPGGEHGIVQDTTLTVSLSMLVYKWVPANLILGVTIEKAAT